MRKRSSSNNKLSVKIATMRCEAASGHYSAGIAHQYEDAAIMAAKTAPAIAYAACYRIAL